MISHIYDNLTLKIDSFLEKFGCTSEPALKFQYCEDDVIQYSILITDKFDKTFTDYARKKGFPEKLDIFVLSLLHEIGHHKTIDYVPFHIRLGNKIMKKIYDLSIKINYGWLEKVAYKYYDLYVERIATEWAINYAKENIEELINLEKSIYDELYMIYDKTGILEYEQIPELMKYD